MITRFCPNPRELIHGASLLERAGNGSAASYDNNGDRDNDENAEEHKYHDELDDDNVRAGF